MPVYEYRCRKCGHQFARTQRVSDPPVRRCERCRGPVDKVFYPVGIIFKGSGWHITDYGRGNGPSKSDGKGKEKAKDKAPAEPGSNED